MANNYDESMVPPITSVARPMTAMSKAPCKSLDVETGDLSNTDVRLALSKAIESSVRFRRPFEGI